MWLFNRSVAPNEEVDLLELLNDPEVKGEMEDRLDIAGLNAETTIKKFIAPKWKALFETLQDGMQVPEGFVIKNISATYVRNVKRALLVSITFSNPNVKAEEHSYEASKGNAFKLSGGYVASQSCVKKMYASKLGAIGRHFKVQKGEAGNEEKE